MGVLECNRDYCENVMCDLSSEQYGRLCASCFEELISLYMNDPEISISKFMNRDKPRMDRMEALGAISDVFQYAPDWD